MTDIYGQFLRYRVTESAASTLTYSEIPTGCGLRVGGGSGIAMEVHAILGLCSEPEDLPATGANEYVAGALDTSGTLSAFPDADDIHLLYRTLRGVSAGVATYLPLINSPSDFPPFTQFSIPVLIANPKLYAYVESSNSATAANFKGHIFHNYVDVDGSLAIEALEVFR